MKFTKLSLVAMLAVSAAFAGESSISGDAKVFYGTDDVGEHDMFNKSGAYGNAAVSLDYTKKVSDNITLNAGITGISTLGLEGTLVGATWADHALEDRVWIDIANVTATFGKTTAVIGRQKLDTPLAFTETWNIVENTFDAFTFVNTDLPETTLVGSLVTRANGGEFTNFQGGMGDLGDGIYTAGIVTKLIPSATTQVWYYDFANNDDKIWAQADFDVAKGITIGAQYGSVMANEGEDSTFMAVKAGYEADKLSAYAAFSQADADGASNFANYGGFGGSPAYTEAWWNFGFVTSPDATTMAVGAAYDMGKVSLGAQFTTVTNDSNAAGEMDELTLTADTSVAGADVSLALINTASDDKGLDGNTVQVYLTLPFSL